MLFKQIEWDMIQIDMTDGNYTDNAFDMVSVWLLQHIIEKQWQYSTDTSAYNVHTRFQTILLVAKVAMINEQLCAMLTLALSNSAQCGP